MTWSCRLCGLCVWCNIVLFTVHYSWNCNNLIFLCNASILLEISVIYCVVVKCIHHCSVNVCVCVRTIIILQFFTLTIIMSLLYSTGGVQIEPPADYSCVYRHEFLLLYNIIIASSHYKTKHCWRVGATQLPTCRARCVKEP